VDAFNEYIHLYYGVNSGKWEPYGHSLCADASQLDTRIVKPLKQKESEEHYLNINANRYFQLLIFTYWLLIFRLEASG
jgi:hypothetical protein